MESKIVEDVAAQLSRGDAVDWVEAERRGTSAREKRWVRNLQVVMQVAQAARIEWGGPSERDGSSVPEGVTTPLAGARTSARPFRYTSDSADVPGHWGHLNLLEKLGAGGFGDVYRAWDPRLNRTVALKLLRGQRDPAPSEEDALLAEARLLARVEHPHVARVYGVERHGDRAGICMELVEGTDLGTLVRESGPLAPREVAEVGIQVARALEAIHGAGVLNRDVKPQNIVRTPEGRVVLVDLGAGRRRSLDENGEISGTPAYMAPELLLGGQTAGPRSDVYGLGVTLFYALTAELPVHGTVREICKAHANGERRGLAELRPDVPGDLRRIVERACHSRPEQRHGTAADLARELEAWLAPPRWTRRPPLMAATAVAAIVLLGLLTSRLPFPGRNDPLSAQVQISGFRDGGWMPLAVNEAITAEDEVQITIQLNREGYVYVFNRDATGSTVVLFPMAGGGPQNPLPAGRPQVLPGTVDGRRTGWGFTPVEGSEEFLVLASERPLSDFEEEMSKYAAVDVGGGLKVRALDGDAMEVAMENARGVLGIVPVEQEGPPQDLFSLADRMAEDAGRGLWMQRLRLHNSGR